MLRYLEFELSHSEAPDETSLCIYISGCPNRCVDCHYPELQSVDTGAFLLQHFEDMLDLYHEYITCVCFLGEGDCSCHSIDELKRHQRTCHARGYKSCLYSGRDTEIEDWMIDFDYLKLGSYSSEQGALDIKSTNQRMFKKQPNGDFTNITHRFW